MKSPKKPKQNINTNITRINPNRLKDKKEKKFRNLDHRFPVYDSMDDDENIDNGNLTGYSIPPNSYFILIYDIILSAFIISSYISLPLSLTYTKTFCVIEPNLKKLMIKFTELLFILDILISFFRGYYNNELEVVLNNRKIIFHYLRNNFISDLFSAIPYFCITNNICKNNDYHLPQFSMTAKQIIIKLIMLTKLFKFNKINDVKNNRALELLYEKLSNIYHLENLVGFILTILSTFFALHIMVCLHIFFGGLRYPNWQNNAVVSDNKTFFSKYISSLYFIITTMSSVGYGDIVCVSFAERIFQIFLLGFGLIVYSFIITKFGNYIKEENKLKIILEEKQNYLEELRQYYPKMSFKLYFKIRNYLTNKYKKKKNSSEIYLLVNSLPDKLRNNMLFTVYEKVTKNFNIFKNCENSSFILEILNCFVKMVYKKDVELIKEGEIIKEIFFVNEGRLALEAMIDINDPVKSLQKYILNNFQDIKKEKEEKLDSISQKALSRIFPDNMNSININDYSMFKKKISLVLNNLNLTNKDNQTLAIIEENNSHTSLNTNENELNKTSNKKIILKILDIRKNESFGDIYLLLEKPAPLTLRVKSKFSEVLILRKKDALKIYNLNQNIVKKITKKSYHNLVSIKKLTYKTIKQFCLSNGFDKDINKYINNNALNSIFFSSPFGSPSNKQKNINNEPEKSSDNYFKIKQNNTNTLLNKMKLNKVNSKNNRRRSYFYPHINYCLSKSNTDKTKLKACISSSSNTNNSPNKKAIFPTPSLRFRKKSRFSQKQSANSNSGMEYIKSINIEKKFILNVDNKNEKKNQDIEYSPSDWEIKKNKKCTTINFGN